MLTMSPLQNAGFFLVKAFFNAYLIAVLLRFILQLVRADFYNPFSQFIVKITNPLLIPIRKWIPGFMGLDVAAILLLFGLQFIELLLLLLIKGSALSIHPTFFLGITVWGCGELLDLTTTIYIYAILIFAILSWLPQHTYNPLLLILLHLINPALKPIQLYIRPISGIDLSPWFLLVILQLIVFLCVHPLIRYGVQLSLMK